MATHFELTDKSSDAQGTVFTFHYHLWGNDICDTLTARSYVISHVASQYVNLYIDMANLVITPEIQDTANNYAKYEVSVRYAVASSVAFPYTGYSRFQMDSCTTSQHIMNALHTRGFIADGEGEPGFDNAINVSDNGGTPQVNGLDIDVSVLNFRVTFVKDPTTEITSEYIASLQRLVNHVNNASWTVQVQDSPRVVLTFAAGEVRFMGFGLTFTNNGMAEVECRFSAIQNITYNADGGPTLTLTDFENKTTGTPSITKNGWQYLWIYYKTAPNTSNSDLIPVPVGAFVADVYLPGDFTPLNNVLS